MRILTVCLDPGHGGVNEYNGLWDGGAVGPSGLVEADIAKAVCQYAKPLLEQAGFNVLLTREGDIGTYYLTPRANMANQAGADIFVSVHCNSSAAAQANGTETYYAEGSVAGANLARCLQAAMLDRLGRYDRRIKEADFTVLVKTAMPAALVEMAFISNPEEEAILASAEAQQLAAQALADGIAAYFG